MTEASAHRSITYGVLPNANAAPISHQTTVDGVPRYRWPSERWRVPTRCPREHCGSRLLDIDPPTPEGLLGEVRCYACSRVVAEMWHDGYRRMTPEQFAALPVRPRGRPASPPPALPPCRDCAQPAQLNRQYRCAACSEARARRARQRSVATQRAQRARLRAERVVVARWACRHDVCVACGSTRYRHHARGLCKPCYGKQLRGTLS